MKQNNITSIDLPINIHNGKNGLTYILHGDYYFPDLNLSDADKTPLGRYGRMRLNYL